MKIRTLPSRFRTAVATAIRVEINAEEGVIERIAVVIGVALIPVFCWAAITSASLADHVN